MENLLSLTEYTRSILWPMGEWHIPAHIELDEAGDRLLWSAPSQGEHSPDKQTSRLLTEFIKLAEAPAVQIGDYARRWGVLQLCRSHNFPRSHPPYFWPGYPTTLRPDIGHIQEKIGLEEPLTKFDMRQQVAPYPCGIRMLGDDDLVFGNKTRDQAKVSVACRRAAQRNWEPLDAWRNWARRAHATLTVATHLHRGQVGSEHDWFAVVGIKPYGRKTGHWYPPQTLEDGWHDLAWILNFWLSASPISPILHTSESHLTMTIGGSSLFGALSLQLLFAVSRTNGTAFCDGCPNVYFPDRKPAASKRNYCPECHEKKIPARNRKRAQRSAKWPAHEARIGCRIRAFQAHPRRHLSKSGN